jgi:hydrogenase expression/formation protein HypE
MNTSRILLAHGAGGRLMQELIRRVIASHLSNPILNEFADSAVLDYQDKLAFTTDSFVVNPLFFSGGDIGKLAVFGSVNDLVMVGAIPQYLSLGLILEEGLEMGLLDKICASLAAASRSSRVRIVTGDLKVVERGACDKIFINTAGLGRIVAKARPALKNIRPQDKIIVTGRLAEHGLAVLGRRKELNLGFNIRSDCCPLNGLLIPLLKKASGIRFMRDPTRGGLSATLNEIAQGCRLGLVINEKAIPLSSRVRAAVELLGLDPLELANEGKAVLIVASNSADRLLESLREHPLGRHAAIIGSVLSQPKGKVLLNTSLGTQRIIEMPSTEALPRIC